MGVKVRFYRGAWWIFINHHGRRRSKKIGDQQTALRIAKELRVGWAAAISISLTQTVLTSPFSATARTG